MLAINGEKATSVSRKHLTIQVAQVREGDSVRVLSHPQVRKCTSTDTTCSKTCPVGLGSL